MLKTPGGLQQGGARVYFSSIDPRSDSERAILWFKCSMRWEKDIGIDPAEVGKKTRILGANIRDFFDDRIANATCAREGNANERATVMEQNIERNMERITYPLYYHWIYWVRGPNLLDILGKMPIFEEIGVSG